MMPLLVEVTSPRSLPVYSVVALAKQWRLSKTRPRACAPSGPARPFVGLANKSRAPIGPGPKNN